MTRLLARIFLLLAVALLLAHYMPAFYDLLAAQRYRGPSFNYSQVERAIIATRPVEGGVIYVNIDSNQIYTREQYQEILPINNHALLMRQERMPTAIDGVALTRQAILLNRADLRVTPRDFQEQVVRMRPLLEAKDVELNLVMPPDFVRPGKQFTFLVPSGNSVDAALTQKFTDALLAAGFEFPVRHFANNPTTRKTFDDGMLLVDNRGQWFRLRREFGQPVIQPLDIGLSPLIIQVREQLNAEIRGLTVTEENELWLLVGPEFRPVRIPLRAFDPTVTRFSLRGNLLDLQFTAVHGDNVEFLVLDRDFNELAHHSEPLSPWYERPGQALKRGLFPVILDFKVPYQNFIGAYFSFGKPWAWLPGLALALLLTLVRRRYSWARCFDVPALIMVVLFGWLGAVAALCIPRFHSTRSTP